jgi:glycosyltransferase involved in cell wall biosynthesis
MRKVAIVHNIPIHYKHLLFTELAREGLDFEVLFTAAGSSARRERIHLQQALYRHRIGYAGPYEQAGLFGMVKRTWASLNQLDPEAVIISGWADAPAWTACIWAGMHRKKRILWSESNSFDHPRRAWKERIKKWFVSRFDGAHVYGTHSRDYVRELGMPVEEIWVKRAVVNTELYLTDVVAGPPQLRSGPRTLLYAGRLSPEKNLFRLIRAFGQFVERRGTDRLILALVGYGPLEMPLKALVSELGLGDLVQFWGAAEQESLPGLYGKADVLILPSTSEAWGLVALEAMCCALPVALSDRCGCAVDVVNPETGWMFSPFDEDAITRVLEQISETPRKELQKMGVAARRLVSDYSPKQCARIVVSSIAQVLNSKVEDLVRPIGGEA